jgi:peptidoglycan-associated lipoprotein
VHFPEQAFLFPHRSSLETIEKLPLLLQKIFYGLVKRAVASMADMEEGGIMQFRLVSRAGAVLGLLGVVMMGGGCSTKSASTDGKGTVITPSRESLTPQAGGMSQAPAGSGSSLQDGGAGSSTGSSSDEAGVQRVVRDPMPEPSQLERERQAPEERRRAEEAATVAAGFQDVFFDYDSFTLSEAGQQALLHDAVWMKANSSRKIRIEGQCDERGTQAYNQVLGEKRAKAVFRYLKDLGVDNDLTVISLGKDRPWCEEHSETCYQKNRRGHLVVRVD